MSHYSWLVQSRVFSEIEDSSLSGYYVNEKTLQGLRRTHTVLTAPMSAAPAIGNPVNEKQATQASTPAVEEVAFSVYIFSEPLLF